MPVTIGDVRRIISRITPGIRALRRDLHRHPEIRFEEKRTARVVAAHLKKLGIPHRTKVGRTGVVGLLEGGRPGPCVALRADMDALPISEENRCRYRSTHPGRMHACGHDGHTAILVGVAHVLSRMQPHLKGSVKFIFQPAEEAGDQGGAELMVADGVLRSPRPAVIFGLHITHLLPLGTVSCVPGAALAAADFFDITVRGRGAHAGYPHSGIDPVAIAGAVIQALQTIASRRVDPLEPVVVTVARVVGGSARNIIPDEVTLSGTCRTYDAGVRRQVTRELSGIACSVARAMGGSAEVHYMKSYPAVVNDRELAGFVNATAREVLGCDHVTTSSPSMGGEDFAFFLKRVPGAFFWLGNGSPERQIHQARFDFDDRALRTGMLVMSALVLRRLGVL